VTWETIIIVGVAGFITWLAVDEYRVRRRRRAFHDELDRRVRAKRVNSIDAALERSEREAIERARQALRD